MGETVKSHGIEFIRHGSCKRCGVCEKPKCPHLMWENGLATCKTYGSGDYLKWNCHVFPNSPFCDVVRKRVCAYTFEPITKDGARLYEEMLRGVKQKFGELE
jgi:hypothetical protein